MAIPMIFRFSYLIEQVFILREDLEMKMIISFVIATINMILQLIHFYFSSVFFSPIEFVAHSRADYYDGKFMVLLSAVRMVIGVVCFEITYVNNLLLASIIIIIVFFICFLVLYLRLTIQVHVSPLGQYLELLPFFTCPFMVLFKYFVRNEVYSIFLLFLLILVFGILFKIYTHFMVKLCLKAFNPFMTQSKQNNRIDSFDNDFDDENNQINSDDFLPKFLIGSIISVIRIVAAEYSDPDCLLRFLQFQKKSSEVKNSCLIEVIRFLALFPSRRKECLNQLKDFHSKSNYNNFMVFIFKKTLKSLNEVESTEKNLVCLNNFYRSFLVHKYLYWVARKEKKYFVASKEALSAAYFFIEVKNEFHYLMKRYTFDSFLHYYYADFYLSACGNFEGYLQECQIARKLDNRSFPSNDVCATFTNNNSSNNSNNNTFNESGNNVDNSLVDPLLHPMSIINPKILQFCSHEESTMNNLSISSPSKQFDISRQASMSNIKKKNRRINQKSSPVATFLQEKKHLIPLLSIFHIYVPIALFLYVIAELYMKDHQIHVQSEELYNTSVELLGNFYVASSTVFLPYLSHEYSNYSKNISSSHLELEYNHLKYISDSYSVSLIQNKNQSFFSESYEIMENFISLPFNIINFYSQIQQLGNMTGGALFILERFISFHLLQNCTIKSVLDNIAYEMDSLVKSIFSEVYDEVAEIKKNAIILREIYKNDLESFYICKVAIITIFVFAFVSSVVYIFQINLIYHNDKVKIDFLSSEHLFSMFLLQESKKAWELLRQYCESSSDATQEISLNSARSSVNLSSIQFSSNNALNGINIIDTKPNQINTNNSQEPLLEMAVNGHNFNEDLRSLINSKNFIQFKISNIKDKFRMKSRKKKRSDKFGVEKEDESSDPVNESNNNNNNNNFDDSNICNQAILISRATEEEAFLSYPYFHLVILLFAPLIFALLVIAMFQIPLSIVASTQEETFQNILSGESLANHSLILLNATFYILEKRAGISKSQDDVSNTTKNALMKIIKEFKENYNHFCFDHNIQELFSSQTEKNLPKNKINNTMSKYKNMMKSRINRNLLNDDLEFYTKEEIDGIDEILSDLKDLSSFKTETCYEFFDIVCMSVESALNMAIESTTTPSKIATECIPFVYLFSWNLFQDLFFSSVNDLFYMKISNGTSFIISTVLLMLTFVHISFSSLILLKKAFNSLFHFPNDFLKPPPKNSNDDSKSYKGKLPQNALVITSITETDEIYSVSDNSKEIINRNLNDLISLKMSKMFQKVEQNPVDEDSNQLCEFVITEKNKKTFRFSTEQIGCLTKTVLIEENSPVAINTNGKSFVQQLNGFIPPYYAELYGKNDQIEFNYKNNFVICVRISHEIQPQMVEKCFNAANHISQNSVSINIINVDGEMITFSSVSDCKLIVVLLLIRDLIDDVFKSTKTKNCIYSVFVQFMDVFSVSVANNEEVYLEFQPYSQEFFRIRLFRLENGKIGFSRNMENSFPSIASIAEIYRVSVDSDGNEESIYTVPMSSISSKIVEFI